MGNRLHVASRYDVRYSSVTAFNWKQEEFDKILNNAGINYYANNELTEFEVTKDDFKRVIEKIKDRNCQELERIVSSLDEPYDQVITIMEKMLIEADPSDYCIHLSFF